VVFAKPVLDRPGDRRSHEQRAAGWSLLDCNCWPDVHEFSMKARQRSFRRSVGLRRH
jgi:hypothetical protein